MLTTRGENKAVKMQGQPGPARLKSADTRSGKGTGKNKRLPGNADVSRKLFVYFSEINATVY